MSENVYHILAVLANVDDSIVLTKKLIQRNVQKWSYRKLLKLLTELDDLPEHEVDFVLKDTFCVDETGRYSYVITSQVKLFETPNDSNDRNFSYSTTELGTNYENQLKLLASQLRLFKEGAINITRCYVYKKIGSQVKHDFSIVDTHRITGQKFSLSETELKDLEAFIWDCCPPFKLPYVQLAFENFDESYFLEQDHLSFLNLMIAVEVLFNVGPHDLRYRIARGMAVLIGEDKENGVIIFKKMRQLYDKRSTLVHTGLVKDISYDDVLLLRDFVRKAIRKIVTLQFTKEKLNDVLTVAGFGQDLSQY